MQVSYPEAPEIKKLVDGAQRIVIVQADNPDGDSLGSALALEHILGDMGKEPLLYSGGGVPTYLEYLDGWDRVSTELPNTFDLSIIVDTSADSLLENLEKSGQKHLLASKPSIILDHHNVENTISFASVSCNHPTVATGELIYELSQQLKWPLNLEAKHMIAVAIMSDSLGLTTEATTARSIHIIGELVESGVSIPQLEQERRELMRKTPELIHYKGELLQRVTYYDNNRVATISIPWREITKYSPLYNPSMLVLEDMRMTVGTKIAIAFKMYSDGHLTAKIRANYGSPIAGELAKHFGGGGHAYSSGFKTDGRGRPFNEIKSECIELAAKLLDNLEREQSHETLQHTDA